LPAKSNYGKVDGHGHGSARLGNGGFTSPVKLRDDLAAFILASPRPVYVSHKHRDSLEMTLKPIERELDTARRVFGGVCLRRQSSHSELQFHCV
jgi:hypothetical protein